MKHREPRMEGETRPPETPEKEEPLKAEATPEATPGEKPAPEAPEAEKASETQALTSELSALREELSAVNDKYLRKLADDINFRKRMAREKEEGQRYALAAILADLVPILDDFDRAVASAETSKEYSVLHDGVLLIRRQMGQMLETKYALARFSSLGEGFDPNRHEAVAMFQAEAGEGCREAVVAEEFLPGYVLHDRVLRTAKVRVKMPAPEAGKPDVAGVDAGAKGPAGA